MPSERTGGPAVKWVDRLLYWYGPNLVARLTGVGQKLIILDAVITLIAGVLLVVCTLALIALHYEGY